MILHKYLIKIFYQNIFKRNNVNIEGHVCPPQKITSIQQNKTPECQKFSTEIFLFPSADNNAPWAFKSLMPLLSVGLIH